MLQFGISKWNDCRKPLLSRHVRAVEESWRLSEWMQDFCKRHQTFEFLNFVITGTCVQALHLVNLNCTSNSREVFCLQ